MAAGPHLELTGTPKARIVSFLTRLQATGKEFLLWVVTLKPWPPSRGLLLLEPQTENAPPKRGRMDCPRFLARRGIPRPRRNPLNPQALR